jgi:hypothetical protein
MARPVRAEVGRHCAVNGTGSRAQISGGSTIGQAPEIGQFVTATPSVEMERLAATATLCRDRQAVGCARSPVMRLSALK